MSTELKLDALYEYAQKLMDVGINVISQAQVDVGTKWARDPKVIALALLSRTLGNLKGAVSLVHQRLLVEAQTLTRCCTENLICVGSLLETQDKFVDELVRAHYASLAKQAQIKIEAFNGSEDQNETIVRLNELVKAFKAKHPQAKKLNARELSKNNRVGSAYVLFSVLSEKAAHVSATSLGRHIVRETENDAVYLRVDIAPDPSQEQLRDTMQHLVETVLAIIVGANEIVCGTGEDARLHALIDDLDAIRKF